MVLERNKMQGQTLPIAKFKAGSVSAAIWENEMRTERGKGVILKTTVQRRYMDRNGQWKNSGSFSRNEIPLAIYCLEQAFAKMIEKQNEESTENNIKEEAVI